MNPSLPNVDLVFCLKFPTLNLTQRLLDGQHVVEGYPQHGLHAGYVVCCKIGWRQLHFSWAYPLINRKKPVKRVNTFKYLRSTLSEDGELDAEVTHIVQYGWKNVNENVWSVG